MGESPLEDYLEIKAKQNGYENYEDLKKPNMK